MITILLAPSADLARGILASTPVALTVEAEYGAFVAEGATYTAAHHQPAGSPYAGNHVVEGGRRSPCCDENIPQLGDGETVLVSHLDLDTFGGCLRAMPEFADLFVQESAAFWNLAEYVDTRGPHRLGTSGASEETRRQLYAFWAWSKGHAPVIRDRVSDVTARVLAAGEALRYILANYVDMLDAGDAFKAEEDELNERTFSMHWGDVLARVAGKEREFCNHLYVCPGEGHVAKAVACLNTESGAVTISLADPLPGVSCRAIVQELWGPEAGGHAGIAGSPRGRRMTSEEFMVAIRALSAAVSAAQ